MPFPELADATDKDSGPDMAENIQFIKSRCRRCIEGTWLIRSNIHNFALIVLISSHDKFSLPLIHYAACQAVVDKRRILGPTDPLNS